jgi:hypothetical protein
MTKISLTPEQKAKILPIQAAGGYTSLSAVVGALIAIYADDLLRRLSIDPSTTLLVPTSAQLVPTTTPLVPTTTPSAPSPTTQLVPTTTQLVPTTTALVPTHRKIKDIPIPPNPIKSRSVSTQIEKSSGEPDW